MTGFYSEKRHPQFMNNEKLLMKYPRVLIAAMGRINATDNANNGLLLRNLFGEFPRENLAQIYSSGDNGDDGFFSDYYELGPKDRRLGRLFFKLKNISQQETVEVINNTDTDSSQPGSQWIRSFGKRLLMDTGLYELIFRPRLSREILKWVENFRPDIIFAQGYNLAFAWLPLILSRRLNLPIAYYPTDDWPDYCYRPDELHYSIISLLVRSKVNGLSRQLVNAASVHFAFNNAMKKEYLKRYGVEFIELMQGDDFTRFEAFPTLKSTDKDEHWIVSTGDFSYPRLPLLEDLNGACEILSSEGIKVRGKVFAVNQLAEFTSQMNNLRFIQFETCPLHDDLVPVLRSADILFLPERFDKNARRVHLSVSSKAHLFMFSGRPIVVYSHPITGIARYAKEEGWAAVVDSRNLKNLAHTFKQILTDVDVSQRLIVNARCVAEKNHFLPNIQHIFHIALCSALKYNKIAQNELSNSMRG